MRRRDSRCRHGEGEMMHMHIPVDAERVRRMHILVDALPRDPGVCIG